MGPFRGTAARMLSSCVTCQSQRKQGKDGPCATAEILGSTGFQASSAGLSQAACAAQGREPKENTGATKGSVGSVGQTGLGMGLEREP